MPAYRLTPVPSLAAGATVALVAPSGGLRGAEDVERASANVRSLGWVPVVAQHVLARQGYLAGSDEQRLADLNGALRDPAVDAIWCIRGGYGSMRLLPHLDFEALRRTPKAVIGYSDGTALHCAIQRECEIVSYHGPVARATLTPFTTRSLLRAVRGGGDPAGDAPDSRTIREGAAEGVLAGGNLAILAALAGTPFAPRLDGTILVLEDIDERTYRIDRMLRQLYLARLLDGCRGIAFGECGNCREATESGARSLDELLREIADLLEIPCLAGVPLGHIADQWTLPLGMPARLDADARTLSVLTD